MWLIYCLGLGEFVKNNFLKKNFINKFGIKCFRIDKKKCFRILVVDFVLFFICFFERLNLIKMS